MYQSRNFVPYEDTPRNNFVSRSDIVMDDDLLLVPQNSSGDENMENPNHFNIPFMSMSEIYKEHPRAVQQLPLRDYPLPQSFEEPQRRIAIKETNSCSHQSIGCSNHINHTLNCPLCKEYFDSKTRYLYIIIIILLIIIIGMKTKFFN